MRRTKADTPCEIMRHLAPCSQMRRKSGTPDRAGRRRGPGTRGPLAKPPIQRPRSRAPQPDRAARSRVTLGGPRLSASLARHVRKRLAKSVYVRSSSSGEQSSSQPVSSRYTSSTEVSSALMSKGASFMGHNVELRCLRGFSQRSPRTRGSAFSPRSR